VNGIDETGWTPLHHAAAHGWEDLLEALLAKGANIKSTGTFGGSGKIDVV
jgi:ankyrin repeat protein